MFSLVPDTLRTKLDTSKELILVAAKYAAKHFAALYESAKSPAQFDTSGPGFILVKFSLSPPKSRELGSAELNLGRASWVPGAAMPSRLKSKGALALLDAAMAVKSQMLLPKRRRSKRATKKSA